MELIADNSIPKYKWELKRTCFDRLEAIVWACFRQYRSTTFCLMKHLKDIALFFDCSERTIRRALNDGAYIHASSREFVGKRRFWQVAGPMVES